MSVDSHQAFTWSEITEDWLRGGQLALSNEEIVSCFNRVVAYFGREWVEATDVTQNSKVRGPGSTLRIVVLGQMLASLPKVSNFDRTLKKLKKRDPSAWSELIAIHIVCAGIDELELEAEPDATAKYGRIRRPDFRVRRQNDDWTYVEVRQAGIDGPNMWSPEKNARRNLERLSSLIEAREGTFSIDVIFERMPTTDEVDFLAHEIVNRPNTAAAERVELAACLGTLYWNSSPLSSSKEKRRTPSLNMNSALLGGNDQRHIGIHYPFIDQRAPKLLSEKVKKFPENSCGLIVLGTNGAIGSINVWQPLVETWLQSDDGVKISGVCLLAPEGWPISLSLGWRPRTQFFTNPRARFPIPGWIVSQFERFSVP